MRGAVPAVLVLAGVVGVTHPRAAPPFTLASPQLVHWLAAVDQHTPGQMDAAAAELTAWSSRDLRAVVAEWLRMEPPPKDPNVRLKRAAILHSDIAILHHHTDGGYDLVLPPATHTATVVSDGHANGVSDGTYLWEFARSLLDGVKPAPERDAGVRAWYRATSVLLQSWGDYAELREHLTRGLRLFPDDPVLLLVAGSQHEAYAEPRIQGPLEMMRALGVLTIAAPTAERDVAIRFLQAAVTADPAAPEAHIRLGRLFGLRGRHDEARSELQRALASPLPPPLEYYAQLFLGTEQIVAGQPVAARRAFERAEALYPQAQSPRLAMSEFLRDTGDREGALSAVLDIERDTGPDADPWWDYAGSHVPNADEALAHLWEEEAQWPR